MQSFFGSLVPAARIAALFGTQYQKAALRVVPPNCDGLFQHQHLVAVPAANSAVASPAMPLPIDDNVELRASNLPFAAAGAADLRAMVAIASSLLYEEDCRRPALADLSNSAILSNPEKPNGQKMLSGLARCRNIVFHPRSWDDRISRGAYCRRRTIGVRNGELGRKRWHCRARDRPGPTGISRP